MDVADRLRVIIPVTLNVYSVGVVPKESGEFVGSADSKGVRHIGLYRWMDALNHER